MSSMFGPNRYAREVVDDTGWMTVPLTDEVNFELWPNEDGIQVRRVHRTVHLRGTVRLLTAGFIDVSVAKYFALMPDLSFAPTTQSVALSYVCQGNTNNRWDLRVYSDARLAAERYGPSASVSGAYLGFYVSWLVD